MNTKLIGFFAGSLVVASILYNLVQTTVTESEPVASKATAITTAGPKTATNDDIQLATETPPAQKKVQNKTHKDDQDLDKTTSSQQADNTNQKASETPVVKADEQAITASDPTPEKPKETSVSTTKKDIFWGPFHTQKRAKSFELYIRNLTEIPVETIKQKHGYSIAFEYNNEDERLKFRKLISEKTGLSFK